MVLKILTFIGLYFIIKNLLKSAFAPTSPHTSAKPNNFKKAQGDIIDAEFKVLKEE